MVAKGKVSIFWQLTFAMFVPVLDIWVFYRIKKLQKMILYVILPMTVLIFLIIGFTLDVIAINDDDIDLIDALGVSPLRIVVTVVTIPFCIINQYLIYKWSREWNKTFQLK